MAKEPKEKEEFVKYVCGACDNELDNDFWEDWRNCPHCGVKLLRG